MITVFNRKNIYVGFDLKKYSDIRNTLGEHGINYTTSVKNRLGQWAGSGRGTLRGQTGSLGQSPDMTYEYEVFVHNKDYEEAMRLIQ